MFKIYKSTLHKITNLLGLKPVRFVMSGGTAAIVEYSSFLYMSYVLDVSVVISNTISFCLGLIVSFLLQKNWVFKKKGNAQKQFLWYLTLALINLFISNVLIVLLVYINFYPLLAKIITMAIIAIWNYVFMSKYIFKHTGNDNFLY